MLNLVVRVVTTGPQKFDFHMMLATERNYFYGSIKWLGFVSDMLFCAQYELNL